MGEEATQEGEVYTDAPASRDAPGDDDNVVAELSGMTDDHDRGPAPTQSEPTLEDSGGGDRTRNGRLNVTKT